MSELLEKFKQHLRENEESYKNGARDSIEYPLGYEEVKLLLNEIERLNKRIKELEEGFKATTEDLCEESTKIEKAIEYINENGMTNITWLGNKTTKRELFKGNASLYELREILAGSVKE